MVNTFHPAVNFDESARLLDKQRLLKQWVESRQIWMVLMDIQDICDLLEFRPMPENKESRNDSDDNSDDGDESGNDSDGDDSDDIDGRDPVQLFQQRLDWYRELQQVYKESGWLFGYKNGEFVQVPRSEAKKCPDGNWYCNVSASAKWEQTGNRVDVLIEETFQKKRQRNWYTFDRDHVFLASEGERLFTLGFGNHTCTLAWIGYSDALAAYTNAHLKYWKSQGGNSDVKYLPHSERYAMPWWLNNRLVCNHRAILHWKAPDKYPEWQPFRTTTEKEEYLWPSQLSEEDRYWLAEGDEDSLNPEEW